MNCYIISYDLYQGSIADYENLHAQIKSYGTWAKILESLWAVKTNETATEIRDHLQKFIDPKDRIFILKSGTEAAWQNVRCKSEWLKTNL